MANYNAGFYSMGGYPNQGMNQYSPYGYGGQLNSLDNTYQSLFTTSPSLLDRSKYPQQKQNFNYTPFSFGPTSQSQPVAVRRSSGSQKGSSYDSNCSLFEKEMLALDKRNRYFSNYYDSSSAGVATASCKDIMTPPLAATILKANFKLLDTALGEDRNGIFNKENLEAIAGEGKNKGLPQNLKDAAQYLLDNEAVYNVLDSETNGKVDGNISLPDLDKYLETEEKMTGEEAALILLENIRVLDTADGGKRDNGFGRNDLLVVANDKKANEKLKKAVQFFLDNQSAFNIIDSAKNGKIDGKVSENDLKKVRECNLLDSFS